MKFRNQSPFKTFHSERGVSVIEALIAMGILSLLMVAHLSWVKLNYGSAGHLNEMHAIEDAMDRLYGAFGLDDSNCTRMFSGQTLNSSISEIRYYDQSGAQTANSVLRKDASVDSKSSVKALDIRLRSVADLGLLSTVPGAPRIVIGDLQIVFGKGFGMGEIVRRIPIYLAMENGRVQRCSISPSGSIVINKRICEIKNDGYNDYSMSPGANAEINNQCVEKNNVVWIQGSELEASCPYGYKVAISDEHLGDKSEVVCDLEAKNGIQYPQRTYQSGYVANSNGAPWRATLDLATSKCTFVSVSVIDPDSFKPLIKCVRQ